MFRKRGKFPGQVGRWSMYVTSRLHSQHILYSRLPVAGLSGFAVFISVFSIVLSLFMLLVPVVYEKYDKLARVARTLKEVRVGFILNGSGTVLNLLIAYVPLLFDPCVF